MKKLMICLLLGLPLALSGCVTAEEMAAQDSNDCHSYGAATGTDAYFQCRMVKSQQHIDDQARRMAAFNHGLDMMAAAAAPPPPPPPPIIVSPNVYVY
jgi:hypothetical protein